MLRIIRRRMGGGEGDPGNFTIYRSVPRKSDSISLLGLHTTRWRSRSRHPSAGQRQRRPLISFIQKTSGHVHKCWTLIFVGKYAGRWPSSVSWSRVIRELSRYDSYTLGRVSIRGNAWGLLDIIPVVTNDASRVNRRMIFPSIWDLDEQETFTSQWLDRSKESSVSVERKDQSSCFLALRLTYSHLRVVKSTELSTIIFLLRYLCAKISVTKKMIYDEESCKILRIYEWRPSKIIWSKRKYPDDFQYLIKVFETT